MKPKRSYLQKLATKVNWFIGYRLQTISSSSLPIQSIEINENLFAYNRAVNKLQDSIKVKYKDLACEYNRKNKS